MSDFFRREALEHYQKGVALEADSILRVPKWTAWSYWLLLSAVLVTVVFGALVTIPENVSGPAIIRAESRAELIAPAPGLIEAVLVASGQRVRAGEIVVRLRATDEQSEMRSVQTEFDAALVRLLAAPRDRAVRLLLAGLLARRDLLSSKLEGKIVRAGNDGVIGDIGVRSGQVVALGDRLMSLSHPDASFVLIALLPGEKRPMLFSGQELRIDPIGLQYVRETIKIAEVDNEIVSPSEARRIFGMSVLDGIPLDGPIVTVRAKLPRRSFSSAGTEYSYFDGMRGTATARVRSQRLLTNLLRVSSR